jgi:S-adenosylmethionine decarboxylase
MDDLAPDIVRQRLLIEGFYTISVGETTIGRYFDALTEDLSLRKYGAPTIFSPSGKDWDENQGYDAFVPLIDSGISLYVWTARRFLAVVLFTCKSFDAASAINTTRDFFHMTQLAHQDF